MIRGPEHFYDVDPSAAVTLRARRARAAANALLTINVRIRAMWKNGYDTLDISRALGLHESEVYNRLARVKRHAP